VGEAVRGDTRLALPEAASRGVLRNVRTGEVALVEDDALRLSRLFATLPFAVLEAESD
jgi:hypothetical protein